VLSALALDTVPLICYDFTTTTTGYSETIGYRKEIDEKSISIIFSEYKRANMVIF
jgi:hypothetical protein